MSPVRFKEGVMSDITKEELTEILVGIAKTQAAVVNALREKGGGVELLATVQRTVGGLVGSGKPNKPPVTFSNLSAHLLLKALATPSPQGQSLEQLASQEVGRLLHK